MRHVPQLALLHENGIGAFVSSHISTSLPPFGRSSSNGGRVFERMMTLATVAL